MYSKTYENVARVTLNAGFSTSVENKLSEQENDMIQEYLEKNGVTKCPPALVAGGETSRATNEFVALERREHRKNNK